MIPIVDYGSIAIVISNVVAVGCIVDEKKRYGFEVFLNGLHDPIIVGFETKEEAQTAREELIEIIAEYYYSNDYDPQFDDFLDEYDDEFDDDDDDEDDDKTGGKIDGSGGVKEH